MITVRRLVGRAELGLSLVAGHEGAERTIEWAHPIELADPTPWLSGGELVMTTGLSIGADPGDQFDYVTGLSVAGCAALAVDTGTRFTEVPVGIRSAGDASGLPVIAVPAATPFIAITKAVIEELTADRVREVQGVVDRQETLARATLRGGIPATVQALGRAVNASVAVLDGDDRILAAYGPHAADIVAHVRTAEQSRRLRGGRFSTSSTVAGGYCAVQSVSAGATSRSVLGIWSAASLSGREQLLMAHAASLIAIELGKPAKMIDAEERLRSATTVALLHSAAGVDDSVLRYFGFDRDTEIVAAVFDGAEPLLEAQRRVTTGLTDRSVPFLMAPVNPGLLVIVPAGAADVAIPALHEELSRQVNASPAAGLSNVASLADVQRALRQAIVASRAARHGQHIAFASLDVFAMFLADRSDDELTALADSLLGPLDAYDDQQGAPSSLVATLHAFLRHNGERESAATELGIHRHTMRNRLARIRELTDLDLDAAQVRAELWIALMARELVAAGGG